MGAFSYHRFIFLLACIDRWKVYNRHVHSEDCNKSWTSVCFDRLAKHGTVVGLLRFLSSVLFACAANNQANLAFKTTIIEDTHLTLAGILFKVEANNYLFFLPLRTYEKNFAEFPFLFIFIIPWYNPPYPYNYSTFTVARASSQSAY